MRPAGAHDIFPVAVQAAADAGHWAISVPQYARCIMASQSNSGTMEAANSRITRLASLRAKSPQVALSLVVAFDIRPLRNGRTSKHERADIQRECLGVVEDELEKLVRAGAVTLGL